MTRALPGGTTATRATDPTAAVTADMTTEPTTDLAAEADRPGDDGGPGASTTHRARPEAIRRRGRP